ncbi:hypothetical protein [uncultured Roseobacter sp.]|uniref:hypothetical protein n=1 Tax=uncultured Roseobacter sp. TaxID=114847 RepID=UPI0026383BFD|nr:hypothetical protein [uncultured Roseobacter sp.]
MKTRRSKLPLGLVAGALVLSTVVAAYADSSNRIKYQQRVKLNVGQAMVVHGYRGDCGQLPTAARMKKSAERVNAALTTGRVQYGKPGVRRSGSCNGDTPAMELIFVATTPGRERVKVFGDDILFIVR